MATKKKTKKKLKKSTKPAGKKAKASKPLARKTKTPRKAAKKKSSVKKAAPKARAARRKKAVRGRAPQAAFSRETSGLHLGDEAGDLQGLSNVESADSESVDELLDEGNAFEAGVVAGVESADDREEQEVRTREVPEDDVPGEYLDEE